MSLTTTTQTRQTKSVNIQQLAVVFTYSELLKEFNEQAPAKKKNCCFDRSDINRFVFYDLLEDVFLSSNCKDQKIWKLKDWVINALKEIPNDINFSKRQIKEINRYSETLLTLPETFTFMEEEIHNKELGHLRNQEFVFLKEEKRVGSVWSLTEKIKTLRSHYRKYE